MVYYNKVKFGEHAFVTKWFKGQVPKTCKNEYFLKFSWSTFVPRCMIPGLENKYQ